MKLVHISIFVGSAVSSLIPRHVAWTSKPTVRDRARNLTYEGVYESGVEAYLGIRYGVETSGQNRFKPPRAYTYKTGAIVTATSNGPACPQRLGDVPFPIYLSNITEISEDCLLLNVKRPNGTASRSSLPVMVFIHGDSLIGSSKDELVAQPSGLILESVANSYPVIHVAMNYRLGSFGFAQSAALKMEGSENAGLRDQRLALEWVKENIGAFGGDPDRVTIFGQSSGGLSVGMQIMAFGGTKPAPFKQAICESQALEGGITGNFTRAAMDRLVTAAGCNTTSLDSAATISCLRSLSTQQLLDAQTNSYLTTAAANLGDEWLPTVDGQFLPDAPSRLITQGKFANVNAIIGWTQGDANIIAPMTISTAQDTSDFLRDFLPGFNSSSLDTLQSMYPVSEFRSDPAANLTSEFFRSARIMRDIVFVCMPQFYGRAISAKADHSNHIRNNNQEGNKVYHYHQNQTFLNPVLTSVGLPDLGVIHTSEMAYVFGNLSHYDVDDFPFLPNASDYALLRRQSRSWSSFANFGTPSLYGKDTLHGWSPAYHHDENDNSDAENVDVFVVGGSQEGLFAETEGLNTALNEQKLKERCGFINSPDIVRQLNY